MNRSIDSMHLSYFVCEEAVAFDDVVVEFVPFRCGGYSKFRS